MEYTGGISICCRIISFCCWIGSLIKLFFKRTKYIITRAFAEVYAYFFFIRLKNFITKQPRINYKRMETSELCSICLDAFAEIPEGMKSMVRLVEGKEIDFYDVGHEKDPEVELILKTKCNHVFHWRCLKLWLYSFRFAEVPEDQWISYISTHFDYAKKHGENLLTFVQEHNWSCPYCKSWLVPSECKHMWYTVIQNDETPSPNELSELMENNSCLIHEFKMGKIQADMEKQIQLFNDRDAILRKIKYFCDQLEDNKNEIRDSLKSIKRRVSEIQNPGSLVSTSLEIGKEKLIYQIPEAEFKRLQTIIREENEYLDHSEPLNVKLKAEANLIIGLHQYNDVLKGAVSNILRPRPHNSNQSSSTPSNSEPNLLLPSEVSENNSALEPVYNSSSNTTIDDRSGWLPVSTRIQNFEQRYGGDLEMANLALSLTMADYEPHIDPESTETEAETLRRRSLFPNNINPIWSFMSENEPEQIRRRQELQMARAEELVAIRRRQRELENESSLIYEQHAENDFNPTAEDYIEPVIDSLDLHPGQAEADNGPESTHCPTRANETSALPGTYLNQPGISRHEEIAVQNEPTVDNAANHVLIGACGGDDARNHGAECSELDNAESNIITELKKLSLTDDAFGSNDDISNCHDNFHICQGLEYEGSIPIGSRIVFRKNDDNLFGKVVRDIMVNDVLWVGVKFDRDTGDSHFGGCTCTRALAVKNCMMIPVCRLRRDTRFSIFYPSEIYPPGVVEAGFMVGTVKVGERIVWFGSKDEDLFFMGTVKWLGFIKESLEFMAGVEFDAEVEDPNSELASRLFPCEEKHGKLVPVREMVRYSDLTEDEQ